MISFEDYKEMQSAEYKMLIAKEILDQLGVVKSGYDSNYPYSGKYFQDTVYEDYGIRIVKPDKRRNYKTDIYIDFCNQRVFDKNTYISGSWESILSEIYRNIDIILEERKENKNLREIANDLISDLSIIPIENSIHIGEKIKIEKIEVMSYLEEEHYKGTIYIVYYENKEVFKVFDKYMKNNEIYTYIPGKWQDEIKKT